MQSEYNYDYDIEKQRVYQTSTETYHTIVHHGIEKSKYSWKKLTLLTIIAGTYVSLGASSGLIVGGSMNQSPSNPNTSQINLGVFRLVYGFIGLPVGFIMIVNCGAELFTSICLYMTISWWERKISLLKLIKLYIISWIGNYIGCIIIAGMYYLSGIFNHQDDFLFYFVSHKVEEPWFQVFVRGIFANYIVCITTWMTNVSLDYTGKIFAIWLPIAVLAMLGYEHCIANMFYLMMALFQGLPLTFKEIIWNNLIPSTLGNIIGGGLCFGTVYSFAYGSADIKLHKYRYLD